MSDRKHSTEPPAYGIPSPGFRIHPETRIGRVRLQVSDLERSLAYYERVLGFIVLERSTGHASLGPEGTGSTSPASASSRPGGTSSAPGSRRSPLIELHEKRGAAPVTRRGRLGLYHYAILLPDRSALGRFVRHLHEAGERAGASDHLVSEALYLHDPDGLGIEVYADRPRSEWRHRDGQLLMATEPLDLVSLVRAAGDEAWSGMPSGTTLGHVHLHVGNLDQAAAFYHEALGLDKMVWSYPGALFLSAGGYHHHLGLNTWAAGAAPAAEDDARLLDWELLVPSPDEAKRTLESVEAAGHVVQRSTDGGLVRDPWQTALRICVAEAP